LFVSQDLGSGNALAPVIKKIINKDEISVRVFATKFSKKIFQDLDIAFTDLDVGIFENAVDNKPDLIVTGASMLDSVEKQAIHWAQKNGIKTLTVLDYWGNYWYRFTVSGRRAPEALPDSILVPDDFARDQMVEKGFPTGKLTVTGNPYFDSFSFLKKQKQNNDITSILFISQPVYKNGRYLTDIKKPLDVIQTVLKINQSVNLVIKPHPKENSDYYGNIKSDRVKIHWGKDIKPLIRESDIIIGTDSTALFESVFSGKPVISYQPEKGRKDNLITNKLGLSYLVKSRDELKTMVQKIIKEDLKKKTLPLMKYYNDGKCTDRVVKKIKQQLTVWD